MQQPYPDHLGPDVAIVIQLEDQIWPVLDDVFVQLAWPHRAGLRCLLLHCLGCFVPESLVIADDPLTTALTRHEPPLLHKLQDILDCVRWGRLLKTSDQKSPLQSLKLQLYGVYAFYSKVLTAYQDTMQLVFTMTQTMSM